MDCAGWLYKQSPTGLKQWQKRWFCYNEVTKCIDYKKTANDTTILGYIPLSEINLVGPSIQIHDKKAGDAGFTIDTQSRIYYLSAEQPNEKEKWIAWLQKLKAPQKISLGPTVASPKTPSSTRDSLTTSNNSNGPSSAQSSPGSRKGTLGSGAPPLQRRLSNASNAGGDKPLLIGAKGQRQSTNNLAPVTPNSGSTSLNTSNNDIKPQVDATKIEEEKKALQRENEKLQGEIAQLTTSNVNLQTELLHANGESSSKSLEVVTLKQELEEMKMTLTLEKDNFTALRSDYDAAKKHLDDLINANGGGKDEQVAALMEQLRHQEATFNKKIEDSTHNFTSALKEKSDQIIALETQLKSVTDELGASDEKYKGRIEELELTTKKQDLSITHLQNQLDQKTLKAKELDTKLQESITENLEMSMKTEQAEKLLKEQIEKNNELLAILEKNREEIDDHKLNATRLQNLVKKTEQEKLEAMTKSAGGDDQAQKIVSLTAELDSLRTTLQEKDSAYHSLEQKVQHVEAENTKLKQEHSTAVESLQKDVQERDDQLTAVKGELQAASVKLNEAETKLAEQQSTVKQIEEEKQLKTQELEALRQELQSVQEAAKLGSVSTEAVANVEEELQAKLKLESAKSAQLQDDLNKFQRDFGVLKSKLEKVKQQILLEKQLRTELDLENTTFKAMVDELEVKNKEYEQKIEDLSKQQPTEAAAPMPVQSNEGSNSELAEQFKEIQQLYEQESRRVQKLEEQNQSLQNEVIDLQENQLRNLNVDNLQLQEQVAAAETRAKELTDKYEETNKIMEQLVGNTEALEKENKHLQKTNQSLTQKLHEAEEKAKKVTPATDGNKNEEATRLKEENDSLSETIKNLTEQVEGMQNELKAANEAKERLDGQLKSLQEKISASEASQSDAASELKQQLEQANSEKNQLQAEVNQLKESLTSNGSVIEQLTSDKTKLEQELKSFQDQVTTSESSQSDAVAGLQQQLERVTDEKNKLHDELNQLRETVSAHSTSLELLQSEKTGLEQALTDMRQAVENQQIENETVAQERAALKEELEKLKESSNGSSALVDGLNAEKSKLEENIRTLQETLENSHKSLEAVTSEKVALHEEFEKFKTSAQENTASVEELKAAKTALEQELNDLKAKADDSSKASEVQSKLENELESAREENKQLNTQLEVTKLQLTSIENDLVSAKVEHESELQTLREKLEGQIESLQTEVQSAKPLSTSGDKVQIGSARGSVVNEAAQRELEAANKLLEETKNMHVEQVEQLTRDLQAVRDELATLKAAPVPVPEVTPNNSAELQRELDDLHEKLTHANTRHDEFVKATKEERERFDNEVKKLSMMVTEERKRVEIKNLEMQAIKLETSNYELETEKLNKQVATLIEENANLKERISHLESLRRSSGGLDAKTDLSYSAENFDFLKEEHAKLRHQIAQYQHLMSMEHGMQAQIAQLQQELISARNALQTQQERFEKEKQNLLVTYATEKQGLMRRLTESEGPNSSTPTFTPTLMRRGSEAGDSPNSPYLVRRPDFDSPSTPIMARHSIAYETSPMSMSYGGSFDQTFMSSPGPDRQREEQLSRQNEELKKHIKAELMLKKEVDDLKQLFAQTLQKVKRSEEEKVKTINGYLKEIEELKKQLKAESSIKSELAELKENYQQTLQVIKKNKEIEQKNHQVFQQMAQKADLTTKENNDLKSRFELSVKEIESLKAKLILLRNEYKKLQASVTQQANPTTTNSTQ